MVDWLNRGLARWLFSWVALTVVQWVEWEVALLVGLRSCVRAGQRVDAKVAEKGGVKVGELVVMLADVWVWRSVDEKVDDLVALWVGKKGEMMAELKADRRGLLTAHYLFVK
jgi:hypothetical protein